ncbi:MAG: metalloregulator ArsR/SmtB family transcription factor [Planctomycetota bacterium]|nr:metalloregulator ArsR/SmtB family transcription factor [Planctomycetota bacterium]
MPTRRGSPERGTLSETARSMQVLGDPVRLRMLRALARQDLTVGEVARIIQVAQSSASRHLRALHSAGLLTRRGAGTASIYRCATDPVGPAARAWAAIATGLQGSPTMADDDVRIAAIIASRRIESREFFGRVGGEWDAIRKNLFGQAPETSAIADVFDPSWIIVDLGCGTGEWSARLAPVVHHVIAVDREQSMLDSAKKRLVGFSNISFVRAPLESLPLHDGSVDLAICSLVLHHIDNPPKVISEALRILRPGGRLLVMDMVPHVREELMRSMGHRHSGFSEEDLRRFALASGAVLLRYRRLAPPSEAKGPGLFSALLEVRQKNSAARGPAKKKAAHEKSRTRRIR